MDIKQFDIWIADLTPRMGTETGKTRPVLIVQTDLLNKANHPSTIVCPLTTRLQPESTLLRVHIKKGVAGVTEHCDIMIDQIRAIDNIRLVSRVGKLPDDLIRLIRANLSMIMDI